MARVTVLMPTYNVAPFVREAAESVLRQSFADLRLLVVDDGSTDGTPDIVRSIGDPRVRVEAFADNVGLAMNLNRGLDLTDTELVARMDGDDIAEPDWLEREVAVLDSHPEIGVCGGGFERFGTSTSLVRMPEWHDEIVANMLFECSIIVPTFRMSLFRDHGLRYRPEAFPAEDYRFWVDAAKITRLHNIPDTLFHYRMHPTQICSARRKEQEAKVAEVRLAMLDWLFPGLSDGEKHYYLSTFVTNRIGSRADLAERRAFVRILREAAMQCQQGVQYEALQRRFESHLDLSLYHTAIDRYFAQGYSLPAYLRYLAGGLAMRGSAHYELKLLAKSILHRN